MSAFAGSHFDIFAHENPSVSAQCAYIAFTNRSGKVRLPPSKSDDLKHSFLEASREQRDVLRDDGSLAARGVVQHGLQIGYWEWFRRDGSLQRSGYFAAGQPVSIWTDFDQTGRILRTRAADTVTNYEIHQISAPD